TGLRAYMGFNEVEACLKEWLGIATVNDSLKLNYNRFGIRQTADKSINFDRNPEVKTLYNLLNEGELKSKKTLLLTGSTGYVGRNLVDKILSENLPFDIW